MIGYRNPLARAVLSRDRVGAAIDRLPWEEQQVLALRYGQEMSVPEVSRIMGTSPQSVEAWQRQGLAALERILIGEEL